MTGMDRWKRIEKQTHRAGAVGRHELEAAASPAIPLKQLAARNEPQASNGNFRDLEILLDQLGSPPVFELGNPLPHDKFMPDRRAGRCPAAHNRALLDEDGP